MNTTRAQSITTLPSKTLHCTDVAPRHDTVRQSTNARGKNKEPATDGRTDGQTNVRPPRPTLRFLLCAKGEKDRQRERGTGFQISCSLEHFSSVHFSSIARRSSRREIRMPRHELASTNETRNETITLQRKRLARCYQLNCQRGTNCERVTAAHECTMEQLVEKATCNDRSDPSKSESSRVNRLLNMMKYLRSVGRNFHSVTRLRQRKCRKFTILGTRVRARRAIL